MNVVSVFPILSPATKVDTPSTLFTSRLCRPAPSVPGHLIDPCRRPPSSPLVCARRLPVGSLTPILSCVRPLHRALAWGRFPSWARSSLSVLPYWRDGVPLWVDVSAGGECRARRWRRTWLMPAGLSSCHVGACSWFDVGRWRSSSFLGSSAAMAPVPGVAIATL